MRIATPAKINLTLEILGQRPDGFHELATWIVPVALYDELSIEFSSEMSYSVNVPGLGLDDSNLVFRAIQRFEAEIGRRAAYRIILKKEIPVGAGLAGGSSDAAATLLLLNHLHENRVDSDGLREIAAKLGSDVAFFLARRSTWCTGRGEQMSLRDFPNDRWVLLIKPEFGVSTAAAYMAYQKLPAEKKRGEAKKTIWGSVRNDLEPAVFGKHLILPEIEAWLERQPETEVALMSGSGSTMFAVIKSSSAGDQVGKRFSAVFGPKFWMRVCRLNPAPLEIEA